MGTTLIEAVTGLYLASNGARLFAYGPQIRRLAQRDRRDTVSVVSWILFATANAASAAYALTVQHNAMLAAWALTNFVPSVAIACLAALRHREARRAAGPAFYSAAFTSGAASRENRARRGRRVDAPFFDTVARNESDVMRFQFRPLGFATGVGVRAARMERAA